MGTGKETWARIVLFSKSAHFWGMERFVLVCRTGGKRVESVHDLTHDLCLQIRWQIKN